MLNNSSGLMTASRGTARRSSGAAIEFQTVAKSFPARRAAAAVAALTDVNLEVPSGEIVGVIGPSGAGKSTLIRLVNGLERVTSGTIKIDGRDVTRLAEPEWRNVRRGIGMIFQHFNLLSSQTVRGNVALPLEVAGASRAAIDKRVDVLLELVGLTDKRDRYPSELSGGQKQRVGIARALATEPRILLCDEATSALDPETTKSILALLKRINSELGVTILLITHEIPVIKEICDKVAVIDGGRIVEQGSVFDVFTKPAHPLTARFVSGVTRLEVPSHIAAELQSPGGSQLVLRVGFVGEQVTADLMTRIPAVFGPAVHVIAARIDTIAGRPFGSLIIAIPDKEHVSATLRAVSQRHELEVEVLGALARRSVSQASEIAHVA